MSISNVTAITSNDLIYTCTSVATTNPIIQYGTITGSNLRSAANKVKVKPYSVFNLPEARLPNKVYLNGLLISIGILGTDVVAAYDGKSKLIFSINNITSHEMFDRDFSIALEYKDSIYYYKNSFGLEYVGDSNMLLCEMVSKANIDK